MSSNAKLMSTAPSFFVCDTLTPPHNYLLRLVIPLIVGNLVGSHGILVRL